MPSRKTHNQMARMVTGENFNNLNALIDMPSIFKGRHHRKYFHSPREALLISAMSDTPDKTFVAYMSHILLDKSWSKLKNSIRNPVLRRYADKLL